jgi:hypothetical protein
MVLLNYNSSFAAAGNGKLPGILPAGNVFAVVKQEKSGRY